MINKIKEYFKIVKFSNTSVQVLIKTNTEIKKYLDNYLKENKNWVNYFYLIEHILTNNELKKCEYCSNYLNVKEQKQIEARNGYYYCSMCNKLKEVKNLIRTNKKYQEKFHNSYPNRSKISNFSRKDIQEKTKQVFQEKYGVNNPGKLNKWEILQSYKDYIIPLFSKEDYLNDNIKNKTKFKFKCNLCGNEFKTHIHKTMFIEKFPYLPRCLKCFPKCHGFSHQEKEVVSYLKEIYQGPIEENRYDYIAPYELDIVLPDLKLAIEYNGDYWHSERNPRYNPQQEQMKFFKCQEIGLNLIIIKENDWKNNTNKVKEYLKGLINNVL